MVDKNTPLACTSRGQGALIRHGVRYSSDLAPFSLSPSEAGLSFSCSQCLRFPRASLLQFPGWPPRPVCPFFLSAPWLGPSCPTSPYRLPSQASHPLLQEPVYRHPGRSLFLHHPFGRANLCLLGIFVVGSTRGGEPAGRGTPRAFTKLS